MKTPEYKPEDIEITPFDEADYLNSNEMIAGYLALSLEDPDPDIFLEALGDVMRAKGVANVAKATGLAREALYRTCQPGKKPQFDTIMRIMRALGFPLTTAMPGNAKKKSSPPTRRRRLEAVTV